MLQLRENEIFETLKKIKSHRFIIIGGYAVNAYTLPRFSVDCDIVIEDLKEVSNLGKTLKKIGYHKEKKSDIPYKGEFAVYKKEIKQDFKVSIDILIKNVLDRQTNASFSAEWVFKNSELRLLKGKTITEQLKLRIINIDALIVMKFISCRATDIRDVFMLTKQAKETEWIKKEIKKRYDFKDRFTKIKNKISSPKFKDDLQGVYGYVDETVFEKHKKAVLTLGE